MKKLKRIKEILQEFYKYLQVFLENSGKFFNDYKNFQIALRKFWKTWKMLGNDMEINKIHGNVEKTSKKFGRMYNVRWNLFLEPFNASKLENQYKLINPFGNQIENATPYWFLSLYTAPLPNPQIQHLSLNTPCSHDGK